MPTGFKFSTDALSYMSPCCAQRVGGVEVNHGHQDAQGHAGMYRTHDSRCSEVFGPYVRILCLSQKMWNNFLEQKYALHVQPFMLLCVHVNTLKWRTA